ncbi:hypothetical protein EST38_g2199 [Candolleomyces aberdarensis]|uniref:Uncharacterized protein n=1 Tax=Candolleomyces aberdarensis TaxID=2316362 RepID=A0A4Q2DTH7_9AGAR|nr:hypothetical protein EST38_g2199 [Candolleomyces aberdarensis]
MPRGSNAALSYLLSSNAVPKTCETASVQVQIDNLTSQIAQLRPKLEELQDQLRLHRAVLSPVRRIPAEIWGQIFRLFFQKKFSDKSDRNQLVALQSVCKTWREAARLEHRLWSGLEIDLSRLVKTSSVEKIEQWLDRSGSVPRSLKACLTNHDDCAEQDAPCRVHNPALAALLVKGGPLYELSLSYKDTQCFQVLLDSLKTVDAPPTNRPWDSLKSLTCIFGSRWTESPDPSKSIFMSLPPNITSFKLELPYKGFAFPEESDSAAIPLNIPRKFLEQLTSFSLSSDWEGLKWLECTLPFCTNVEELSIDFNFDDWSYDRNESGVQQRFRSGFLLPKVRTLSLQNVYSPSLDILSFLKTPQLVDLGIEAGGGENMDCKFAELVLEFIKRSNCEASMRRLRLCRVQLDAEQLAGTLRGLPFLTHLTLDGVVLPLEDRYGNTFDILNTQAVPLILPQLEVLELLNLDFQFSGSWLLEFLESRRPFIMENGTPSFQGPPDTLKKLTVAFRPTVQYGQTIDTTNTIRVLKKWCGVSVHVGPKTYVTK